MVTCSAFEVAEGVYQIESDTRKKLGCSVVYLVADGGLALVETGPASLAEDIIEGISQLGYDPNGLSYIIATHVHVDHSGGVGYLAERFPQARVVLHEKGARHLLDPSRLIEGTRQAFGEDFEERYGPILPVPQDQLLVVEGGEGLALNGRRLQVIYAPGHAPHHMVLYDEKVKGLFCGEALGNYRPGTDYVRPGGAAPGFDLEVFLETIARLKELDLKVLFYSHHGVGRDVPHLLRSVEENARAYGEIILRAMKAGESEGQMVRRLEEYYRSRSQSGINLEIGRDLEAYTFYFKKRGMA